MPAQISQVRHQLGLDRSLVTQYLSWLWRALHGNFGISFRTGQPVGAELASHLAVTAVLAGVALAAALAASLVLGLVCGAWARKWPDAAVRVFSSVGVAVPDFAVGLVLIIVVVVHFGVGQVVSDGACGWSPRCGPATCRTSRRSRCWPPPASWCCRWPWTCWSGGWTREPTDRPVNTLAPGRRIGTMAASVRRHRLLRRLARHRGAQIGAAVAVLLVLAFLTGPLLWHASTTALHPGEILLTPSGAHPLGTDEHGRDELARLLAGGRRSLLTVVAVIALALTAGLLAGIIAGVAGGPVDAAISRVTDVVLAFPPIVAALVTLAVLGPGFLPLVAAVAVSFAGEFVRLARTYTLTARGRPVVLAARLSGIPWWRTGVGHVLPETATTLIVVAALNAGHVLVTVAGLSFLGFAAQPPIPEWGLMLSDARLYLAAAPWLCSPQGWPSSHCAQRQLRRHRPGRQPAQPGGKLMLLQVEALSVTYPHGARALCEIDLVMREGQCLAVVGESGSGKTTLALAILGLLPPKAQVTGSIRLAGQQLVGLAPRRHRALRGTVVGPGPPGPVRGLRPAAPGPRPPPPGLARARSAARPGPGRRAIHPGRPGSEPNPSPSAPVERGELQRATIAAATAHRPALVVADEPTTALDAELREEILTGLRARSRSLLLISHDLTLVAGHAETVVVCYAGRIVEVGPAAEVLAAPQHPYTRALLAAVPRPGHGPPRPLPGAPPDLTDPPTGCVFASRCPLVEDHCRVEQPPIRDGVACPVVTR